MTRYPEEWYCQKCGTVNPTIRLNRKTRDPLRYCLNCKASRPKVIR